MSVLNVTRKKNVRRAESGARRGVSNNLVVNEYVCVVDGDCATVTPVFVVVDAGRTITSPVSSLNIRC